MDKSIKRRRYKDEIKHKNQRFENIENIRFQRNIIYNQLQDQRWKNREKKKLQMESYRIRELISLIGYKLEDETKE